MSYTSRFKKWFTTNVVQPPTPTLLQKLLGLLGIILGALSATVNLPLGYAFGEHLAEQLRLYNLWHNAVGWYFGITAVIPLFFLAARTAYIVLQGFAAPPCTLMEGIFKSTAHRFKGITLWLLALLSPIPFLYITHTNLFARLGNLTYLVDFAAYFCPVLVNHWALQVTFNMMLPGLRDWFTKDGDDDRTRLRFLLKHITSNLQQLSKSHAQALYHQIHLPRYQNSDALTLLCNVRLNRPYQIAFARRFIGLLGALIGAVSTYQYYGNGLAGANWLHLPLALSHCIALSALICNASLGAYTGNVVFDEFYQWVEKALQKMTNHSPLPPMLKNTRENFLQFAGLSLIFLVAVSAATPNVYLTIQLQRNPTQLLNLLISMCAFIGPFVTNFYAISNIFIQATARQKLISYIEKITEIIPDLHPATIKALLAMMLQQQPDNSHPNTSSHYHNHCYPHLRLITESSH